MKNRNTIAMVIKTIQKIHSQYVILKIIEKCHHELLLISLKNLRII